MKIKIISELFSAAVLGAFFGLHLNGLHQKWHMLGREAYLAHHSQNFDELYANPASAMHLVLIWVITALSVFALYKGIAFMVAKVLFVVFDKNKQCKSDCTD
jgi:hypothetical protein